MLYLSISLVIGGAIGAIGYFYTKAFLGLLFGALPGVLILLKYSAPFMNVMGSAGVGNGTLVSFYAAMWARLPQDIQSALIFLPVAVIGGRLSAWVYVKFLAPEPKVEDKAARRKRILAEYGMS